MWCFASSTIKFITNFCLLEFTRTVLPLPVKPQSHLCDVNAMGVAEFETETGLCSCGGGGNLLLLFFFC